MADLLLYVGVTGGCLAAAIGFFAWFGAWKDRAESAASGFQPDRPYTDGQNDLAPFFGDYSADPHDMRPASALDNNPTRETS